MRIRHETLGTIFELVYLVLMTNILLVIGCLPLVAGLVATDPARSWPLLALVAPLCTPGLCAVFAVYSAYGADRSIAVITTFVRAWRASLRRACALGAVTSAGFVVLGVDLRAAWGKPVGAVAIPMLVVAGVLVAATALLAVVTLAERPTARLRDVARASLYLALRHWYLTALSFVLLAVLEALFASRPALALGVAAAPLLYGVWANSRFSLRTVLGPGNLRPTREK
jgi:uncharacterized membrane protein YesL